MAEQWIKVTHITPDKPEVFEIAERLQIDPDAVLGKLVRAWVWADQQTLDGNAPRVTRALLDRITAQHKFAEALIDAGWLADGDDGLEFVNFERHNGKTAKKRALTNRRVSEARKKTRNCNGNVTQQALPKALPDEDEDEDEEKDITTTTGATCLSHDWSPKHETINALITLHQVPSDFQTAYLAEWRIYWTDRGVERESWDSQFLQQCARQWRKHGHEWGKTGKLNSTRGRSLEEDLSDTSWAR